jgi:hypothetical protein
MSGRPPSVAARAFACSRATPRASPPHVSELCLHLYSLRAVCQEAASLASPFCSAAIAGWLARLARCEAACSTTRPSPSCCTLLSVCSRRLPRSSAFSKGQLARDFGPQNKLVKAAHSRQLPQRLVCQLQTSQPKNRHRLPLPLAKSTGNRCKSPMYRARTTAQQRSMF